MSGGDDYQINPDSALAIAGIVADAGYSSLISNLAVNAENAASQGNKGLAGLLYSDLVPRLNWMDTEESRQLADQAEYNSYICVAEALAVDHPVTFDPVQSRYVPSQMLIREARGYQETNGLEVTSQLDYRTLAHIAGDNVSRYWSDVIQPKGETREEM